MKNGSKNISIKDIAQFTGVSTSTVSRVLNDNGRFSDETKRRVLDAVEKLGYRSNVLAKSLRTMKTYSVGVIVPDITNEFFSKLVLGIENYCYPKGYLVYICNTSEDREKELESVANMEARGVDGLIDLGGVAGEIAKSFARKVPVVYIDRRPNMTDATVIESDNYTGGFIATEELISKGCSNILLLRDHRDLSTMNQRVNGYFNALNEYDLPIDMNNIFRVSVSKEAAESCVKEILESGKDFDGIFATSDWLAVGALKALEVYGKKVPDEVKIVGFDNIQVTEFVNPKITTVNQDEWTMGKTAARLLLDSIENNEESHQSVQVPVELVRRETT